MRTRVIRLLPILLVTIALGLVAACGDDDPTPTPRTSAPAATPTATTTSTAPDPTPTTAAPAVATATPLPISEELKLAGILPKDDFYEVDWPIMKAAMAQLHTEALAEEGGELSLWGFNEIAPLNVAAFAKAYPGMSITSQGRQFATGGAIRAATAAGQFTTDSFGGAYNIYAPVYELIDQEFDWTQYGVPEEFLDPSRPGMMHDSSNSFVQWYNTNLLTIDDIPTDPFEYLDPKWKGQMVSSPSYFFAGFSYIALKHGAAEAKELAIKLLDEQDLLIVSNPEALLIAGERAVMFPTFNNPQEFRLGAPINVKSYEGVGVWAQQAGIMKNAQHPKGAALYELWSAFDPDWIAESFGDTDLAIPSPHLGLPRSTISQNNKMLVSLIALENDWATWLTLERLPARVEQLGIFQGIVLRGE
ncbi:MAG: hypothetical protein V3S98_02025, partial [Dehalococcoidia bacterium]